MPQPLTNGPYRDKAALSAANVPNSACFHVQLTLSNLYSRTRIRAGAMAGHWLRRAIALSPLRILRHPTANCISAGQRDGVVPNRHRPRPEVGARRQETQPTLPASPNRSLNRPTFRRTVNRPPSTLDFTADVTDGSNEFRRGPPRLADERNPLKSQGSTRAEPIAGSDEFVELSPQVPTDFGHRLRVVDD
jgi:hypothetical protein